MSDRRTPSEAPDAQPHSGDGADRSFVARAAAPAASARLVGFVLAVFALTTVVRGLLASYVPLLEAETYYWLWSDRLAWGYVDHPPGVAVGILAGTSLFGLTEFGARSASVLLGTVGLSVFYLFCRRLVSPRAALSSLLLAVLTPFWSLLGVVITPDAPLLCGWVVALLFFHRAVTHDRWSDWLITGVATGLTMLSKYNGFQLPAVFFVYLLTSARGRTMLRSPKPWVAVALALALVSPNLVWNAGHRADTLRTPLEGESSLLEVPRHLAELVALPFLLLSPVAAWAAMTGAWRGFRSGAARADDGFRLLLCATFVPLGAFVVVACATQIHAHWIATALIGAIPLAFHESVSVRLQRASLVVAGGLAVVLLGVPFALGAFGEGAAAAAAAADEPSGIGRAALELHGWDELGDRIDAEIAAHAGTPSESGRVFLGSRGYHITSALVWAARGRHRGFPLDRRARRQFRRWYSERDFIGDDALIVEKWYSESRERALGTYFEEVVRLDPVRLTLDGRQVERFLLYWCRGYRGTPAPGEGEGSRRSE